MMHKFKKGIKRTNEELTYQRIQAKKFYDKKMKTKEGIEYFREKNNRYKKTEKGKIKNRRDAKIRRALHLGADGLHTLQEWKELKKKFNNCCAICGRQEPFTDLWYQYLTEDHIIPLTKGGNNYIENIQPLCINCNTKKGNKLSDWNSTRIIK